MDSNYSFCRGKIGISERSSAAVINFYPRIIGAWRSGSLFVCGARDNPGCVAPAATQRLKDLNGVSRWITVDHAAGGSLDRGDPASLARVIARQCERGQPCTDFVLFHVLFSSLLFCIFRSAI